VINQLYRMVQYTLAVKSNIFRVTLSLALFLAGCASLKKPSLNGDNDAFLWLEDIEGKKSLDWVKAQNKISTKTIAGYPGYKAMVGDALKILEDKNKIPKISIRGGYLYNFWQDKDHVRGLWRRIPWQKFQKTGELRWEVLLDVDALDRAEKQNWIYKGAQCLPPSYDLCLVELSRGGTDASTYREYQISKKAFVKKGFHVKEAKSWVSWRSKDEIFVATNYGADTLSESGYPLEVKSWKRGSSPGASPSLFKGNKKNMIVGARRIWDGPHSIDVLSQLLTFYSSKNWLLIDDRKIKIPKPDSANIFTYFKGHVLIELREDWSVNKKTYTAGSLVAIPLKLGKEGAPDEGAEASVFDLTQIQSVFQPSSGVSVLGMSRTKNHLLVNILENVKGKVFKIGYQKGKGFLPPVPVVGDAQTHTTIISADSSGDHFYFQQDGFLKPKSLGQFDLKTNSSKPLKKLDNQFSSSEMVVYQKWASSKDGTKVPYFLFGQKKVIESGKAPTLLYGYGGFEISRTPFYSGLIGKLWLENGGVYAIANIRGGGEFGPKWHQAALKTNRHKAYDDFIAVSEALISSGVTTSRHLGIYGRSNGGLLVGAIMTRRPDLYRAVVCGVPLLDMIRYSQLLAGASWMGEYGDPRKPKMYSYLRSYSPYHNVNKKKNYPSLLLMTSTKDDRVHPGHARKMAAKMMDQGHPEVLYFENTEGGHKGSANLKQLAERTVMRYAFLFKMLR